MLWWYWVVLGLALVALELATPGGFFVIFFAIAALAVGALTLVGVIETAWLQWLLFPVIAIVGLRLFRQPLLGRMGMRGVRSRHRHARRRSGDRHLQYPARRARARGAARLRLERTQRRHLDARPRAALPRRRRPAA